MIVFQRAKNSWWWVVNDAYGDETIVLSPQEYADKNSGFGQWGEKAKVVFRAGPLTVYARQTDLPADIYAVVVEE